MTACLTSTAATADLTLSRVLCRFVPEVARAIDTAAGAADTAPAQAERSDAERRVAVFDADGTLWDHDIGEAFLRWLLAGDLLPAIGDPASVWSEYEARVTQNRTAGYVWAAQIMAGLWEEDVERWSRQLAFAWPNYRRLMRELIAALAPCGIEAWIVSASPSPVVRAAGVYMGVPRERCIGMLTEIVGGVLTDKLIEPATCERGKVQAVDRYIGAQPLLAFGDSMGDFELLSYAQHAVVLGGHGQGDSTLLAHAAERCWPVHLF